MWCMGVVQGMRHCYRMKGVWVNAESGTDRKMTSVKMLCCSLVNMCGGQGEGMTSGTSQGPRGGMRAVGIGATF